MSHMTRYQKALERENRIRNMMGVANRIVSLHTNANRENIKKECPEFTPREVAQVRSILVNGGVDCPKDE